MADVADLTPLDVARRVAADRRLPEPELVRVGMNHTFRAGPEVIRVSSRGFQVPLDDVTDALRTAGVSHAAPTGPLLEFDGWEATTWEWCEATAADVDFAAFGAAIRRVHDLDRPTFASVEPLRFCGSFPHLDLEHHLAKVRVELDTAAADGLDAALTDLADWRSAAAAAEQVVCHGDVHFNNVIAPAVVIDWDMLCGGPRAWDHAPTLSAIDRWGLPAETYDRFAEGYGMDLRDDPLASSLAQLRDLAATIMLAVRVHRGGAPAAAATELEVRLQTWRGAADAPIWNAQ